MLLLSTPPPPPPPAPPPIDWVKIRLIWVTNGLGHDHPYQITVLSSPINIIKKQVDYFHLKPPQGEC